MLFNTWNDQCGAEGSDIPHFRGQNHEFASPSAASAVNLPSLFNKTVGYEYAGTPTHLFIADSHVRLTSMLRWIQRWLQPVHSRSVEALSVDPDGQPVLSSDSEWIVEIEGRPVALLSHPKWAEMFWTSYEMTPLTEEPEIVAKLHDADFWRICESLGVTFRHRASSVIARYAFPGLSPFREPGRIVMRGLW